MTQKMHIQDYEVNVHLGSSQEEQKFTQPVYIGLEITFKEATASALSDSLVDAVDYVELIEIFKDRASEKNYFLIEHLNFRILDGVRQHLMQKKVSAKINLSVKKIRVPVPNLRNGVVFSCETEL